LTRFCRFLGPDNYLPGLWDLRLDGQMADVWRNRFRKNLTQYVDVLARYGTNEELELVTIWADSMVNFLDQWRPTNLLEFYPTVWHLTLVRETMLRACGLDDPYKQVKKLANEEAFNVKVPADIDPFSAVLAGNWFDLASPKVTDDFFSNNMNFSHLLKKVSNGEWLFNHCEKARSFFEGKSGIAIIMVDNAGIDIVCGISTLIEWLLKRNWQIYLAANRFPALNDITANELESLIPDIARRNPIIAEAIRKKSLKIIESGSGTPGFVLTYVSEALNSAAKNADTLIIIGQGRGIETTSGAIFDLPVLRLATIKSVYVAAKIGCRPGDLICYWQDVRKQFVF